MGIILYFKTTFDLRPYFMSVIGDLKSQVLLYISLPGVALGSAAGGIGEMTFLSLTSHFNK